VTYAARTTRPARHSDQEAVSSTVVVSRVSSALEKRRCPDCIRGERKTLTGEIIRCTACNGQGRLGEWMSLSRIVHSVISSNYGAPVTHIQVLDALEDLEGRGIAERASNTAGPIVWRRKTRLN